MKQIPLSQCKFALVDDEDYENLSKYKWCLAIRGNKYYASCSSPELGRGSYMHRIILGLEKRSEICDHIDGNGLNNQRDNLRRCNSFQNGFNKSKYKNNKSGFKGVIHQHGKWSARIRAGNKEIHIGCFDSPENAARAYNQKCIELHGEFAKTNDVYPILPTSNIPVCQSNNTSGFRGVSFCNKKKRWRVSISAHKKKIHLGYFVSKDEAATAYNNAAKKHFGERAKLNVV